MESDVVVTNESGMLIVLSAPDADGHYMPADVLSSIRHSKSNQAVFKPEFLLRIKRFIIFQSLDEEVMQSVRERLVDDLQANWRLRRQRALAVWESFVAFIGQRAFALEGETQEREGGSTIRTLLADMIEFSLQDAVSTQREAYGRAARIMWNWAEPSRPDRPSPCLAVRFE